MPRLVTLLALAIGLQVVPPPPASREGAGMRAEWRAILAIETEKLEQLARESDSAGRREEAEAIRGRIVPPLPENGPEPFPPLPEFVPRATLAGSPTDAESPAWATARQARAEAAESLWALARRAGEPGVGRYALAINALRAVLDRDPNHREARRLIGYVEHDGGWATPHAARNLQAGYVLHPTFGWVPADWVDHLEQGQLPGVLAEGRPVPWLPAAEADALRRDFFRRPWQISTEHFDIATNVPLAEAIAFGRRLEAVRDAFVTLFADVLGPENLTIDDRFRDPNLWASPSETRHQVWYFAERVQYVGYFKRIGRDESQSLGYYMPAVEAKRYRLEPRSYFFRNDGDPLDGLPTLFHEASHQLLFELAGPSQYDRNVGQYWIWEGLGTYFESFTPRPNGAYEIGGRDGPRMTKARRDLVEDRKSLPVADLVSLSATRFQDQRHVYTHYAQAMALVSFLMHAEQAAYRDPFLDYVADAYRGRFRPGAAAPGLLERLDFPPAEIDARFRTYLTEDAEVAARPRITPGGNFRPPNR